MKTFFIFVSPQGSDPEVSENLQKFYYHDFDKRCREWSIDFFFFPALIEDYGMEEVYKICPIFQGLSIDEIYDTIINAYRDKINFDSPGIIVIREGEEPLFEKLDSRRLYEELLYLPESYGQGGTKSNGPWYKYKKHTTPTIINPSELMHQREVNEARVSQIKNLINAYPPDKLDRLKAFYEEFSLEWEQFDEIGEALVIKNVYSDIRYSDIRYSKYGKFTFCDYNITIKLSPEDSALFLFYLIHNDGVYSYDLEKYRDEFEKIFLKFSYYNIKRPHIPFNEYTIPRKKFVNVVMSIPGDSEAEHRNVNHHRLNVKIENLKKSLPVKIRPFIGKYCIKSKNNKDNETKFFIPAAKEITIIEE